LHDSPLYRFQGDFARKFGKFRRGVSMDMAELHSGEDSDSMHEYHLTLGVEKR
jgi:hypothetical protein